MKHRFVTRVFLIALLGTGVAAADVEKTIHRSFSVDSGGTLELDSDSGSVDIRSHSSNEVLIDVTLTADTRRESEAEEWFEDFELDFDQAGRDISIVGKLDRNRGFFRWRNRLRVHYDISIPENYNIDLDTAGGSFDIRDMQGNVRLNTAGGSIRLAEIVGDVRAHTSGGSITTDGVLGDLDISSSGGSLRLSNIHGNVVAKTSGGSVSAEVLNQTTEAIDLSTSGGNIALTLPSDFEADIDASAAGGTVSTELPVLVSGTVQRSSLRGELNGGGVPIRLYTAGGRIRISEF